MPSSKQLYYFQGLVGKELISGKIKSREDLWDKIGLLPETNIEDLTVQEMTSVIKTVKELSES